MSDTACSLDQREAKAICLKEICFKAVRKHFAALGSEAVVDLPVPLIEDLLPHLTVCQLEELQPFLNQRGVSTYSGWVGILQDMCGHNHVIDRKADTEEKAKHEVMRMLFTVVFYGFTNPFVKRNITNLNTPSFLWAAAQCIRKFFVITSSHKQLLSLTAEKRPFLNLLEKCINSVTVSQCTDLSKRKTDTALYVLHRLLDHGVVKELVVNVQCPIMLAWLLHRRGSQYMNHELTNLMHRKKASCISQTSSASCSPGLVTRTSEDQDGQGTLCKRLKLDSVSMKEKESGKTICTVDPQVLCQTFSSSDGPSAAACPWGQINCLNVTHCGSDSLKVLNSALPTFYCLRSLTLHSFSTFKGTDVLCLARALRQLSNSSQSSLTDLSISVLPHTELMEILLDTSPNLTSLHVEIQTVTLGTLFFPHHHRIAKSDISGAVKLQSKLAKGDCPNLVLTELPLEKLTVKLVGLQTDLHFVTSVLRRSPQLTSFYIAGIRLPTGSSQSRILTTLSESNHLLRSLSLEDMKLSDCLPEILNLLRNCNLEELQFNDCRLLEKWSNKEQSLQQLVASLKAVSSLHTLSLAQNRLAKNLYVLAELFSGCSASSVKRLDISSNFIQPADLLEFTKRLQMHHPQQQLTLDLRKNPGDRDINTWYTALEKLRAFCVPVVERWTSSNIMVDHISNM